MSGSKASNTDALNYQKEQDTLAQQKEATRQQRIQQGTAAVKAIYEGAPVMKTQNNAFDWGNWGNQTSQFGTYAGAGGKIDGTQVPGMPAGYTYKVLPGGTTTVVTPGQATTGSMAGAGAGAGTAPAANRYNNTVGNTTQRAAGNISTNPNQPNYQGGSTNVSTNPNTPNYQSAGTAGSSTTTKGADTYGIVGPDGKVYKQGDALDYTSQVDTGQRTGGFDDAFYNRYNKAYQDLYNPDEQRSYNYAKQKLLFNATDQGIVNSSAMGDKLNELGYQDTKNKGKIVGDASTATANLRNTIDTQKQNILNQLYATDDPDIAATAAQSSAKASQLQTPTLTPGTAWFDPALSAMGGYVANVTSPYRQGTSSSAAPSGPAPAPASRDTSATY